MNLTMSQFLTKNDLMTAQASEIERLRDANLKMREVLEWLNRRGGLGSDVHDTIKAAIHRWSKGR